MPDSTGADVSRFVSDVIQRKLQFARTYDQCLADGGKFHALRRALYELGAHGLLQPPQALAECGSAKP